MRTHRNAAEVLPPDLLAEVQKYCTGSLWVPETESFHAERRRLVEGLLRRNLPVSEVARLADLTRRRVRQIRRGMVDAHEAKQ